ncbi:hypothetical protein SDC9_76069 [bioreactor metagenome]|uniref:Uncharacterized protein n=1 Tax=bioreactor metagenome TaxID=1076179 RepID=A0A644YMJ0_9ZZZZ
MRIFRCVAVAGKVFGNRHHTVFFHPPAKGDTLLSHIVGKLAKGARSYDRIQGIAVHIDGWGEVDVDTHFTALPSDLSSVRLHGLFIVNGANNQVSWKTRCVRQAHRQAPFAVQCYKKRRFGNALDVIGHLGLCCQRAFRKQYAPYLLFVYIARNPCFPTAV